MSKQYSKTRLQVLSQSRNINFVHAALVGLAAGWVAVSFFKAITFAIGIRTWIFDYLQSYRVIGVIPFIALCSAAAALAAFITKYGAPEATGSGIAHVKAAVLHLRRLRPVRLLIVKFSAGVLALASGLSLGREGPTIHLGAAVGELVGSILRLPRKSRTNLMAAGAGAGLAAAFNAPLAGFIFVIEELRRELSPLTYGTALVAAVIADILARLWVGSEPSFHLAIRKAPAPEVWPLILILGILAGLAGTFMTKGLLESLRFVETVRHIPRWIRAALIGALAGLLLWYFPTLAQPSDHLVEEVVSDRALSFPWYLLLGLLIAKFLFTFVSYSAGVPGGIFAPQLALGALIGVLVGRAGVFCFPDAGIEVGTIGNIGMAAFFAGCVRAPLTGVILIIELTANYDLLFPLMLACSSAYIVSEMTKTPPVYEALLQFNLRRRGAEKVKEREPVIVDIAVESGSPMDGTKIKNLKIPRGCLLVTVNRGGTDFVPDGETILLAGDALSIVTTAGAEVHLQTVSSLARSLG